MSDVAVAPPPPPPESPPETFDFAKPFTFVFDDPEWISKILLGAVFSLASIFLVGIFFINGYVAKMVRQVIDGVQRPLPDWSGLGDYFVEGVRLFVIIVIYFIPLWFLALMTVPFSIIANIEDLHDVARLPAALMSAGVSCLIFPLSLLMMVWVPAALLRAVAKQDFSAAFDFRGIANFIRANTLNYLLAVLIMLVARFIAGLGLLLCCVGVFATAFWAALVSAHAFAQAYRLASER